MAQFHVAISYASEDEKYVEEVADILRKSGITVFFAKWEQSRLIGRNLAIELPEIFGKKAHHCLLFVSNHYADKVYTIHEWNAISERYMRDREYLLPARFDDAELRGLGSAIAYADVRPKMSPAQLASLITARLAERNLVPPVPARASSPAAPFVGRKSEIQKAMSLLRKKEVRVLVLHGEGGVGKTRLAQHLLEQLKGELRDGACPVYLKRASDFTLISEIGRALDIREAEDVSAQDSTKQFLRTKEMLLLLDNFEHLSYVESRVGELVKECPGLKVLITSRRTLDDLKEIQNLPVPPLSLPPEGKLTSKRLLQSDAVALFQQHASMVDPEFEVTACGKEVAAICEALGGNALAIEVTAARINWYKPPEMLARLKQYLKGEGDAGLALRETIHASVDWSYSLLSPDEQLLFRRVSVFAGGCTPEEAGEICDGGLKVDIRVGLERLADFSLLRRDLRDPKAPRFSMLDMVREYALERLKESQEAAGLRRLHAGYFVRLAEQADERIQSKERDAALALLNAERANLRAAFEWCQSEGGDRELGLRLSGALFWFWNLRADFSEGRAWLEEALQDCKVARAKALYGAGGLAFLQGDYGAARLLLDESVRLWRGLGPAHERGLGYALIILGMTVMGQEENTDLDLALSCEAESVEIFRRHETEDGWGLALALNDLGNVHRRRGNLDEAARSYRESLARWQALRDPWGLPLTLSNLGFLQMMQKMYPDAREMFERAQDIQEKAGDTWSLAETRKYRGDLEVRSGQNREAGYLYRESLEGNRKIGRKQFMVGCLSGLAVVAAREGRHRVAARLSGAAGFLREHGEVSPRIFDCEQFSETFDRLPAEVRESKEFQAGLKEGMRDEPLNVKLDQTIAYALEKFPPRPEKASPPAADDLTGPKPAPDARAPRPRSAQPRPGA